MSAEGETRTIKELHFGDFYISKSSKEYGAPHKWVVINVGSESEDVDYRTKLKDGIVIHVASVLQNNEGNEVLGAVGTVGIDHIDKMLGNWSFERVVSAITRQLEGFSQEEIKEIVSRYKEHSSKPHRVIG